jgi:starch phosphorylase
MKFVLNGGLIIGTCDGANIEVSNVDPPTSERATDPQIQITREVGEENIFLFGNLSEDVEDLRHAHFYQEFNLDPMLQEVFKAIREGMFGDAGQFSNLVNSIVDHGDYYLVSDDFKSYIDTQKLIDEAYKKQDEWLTKTITSVSRMGFFSSDRCIDEYAEMIWNIEPVKPESNGA